MRAKIIGVDMDIYNRVKQRLRGLMPGMTITIDVYAKNYYGENFVALLLDAPGKLLSIVDKLLQNDVAKRIVIGHIVRAVAGECRLAGINVEKLAEESVADPEKFEEDVKRIIAERAKGCSSRRKG